MKSVLLFRHAKSDWSSGVDDHDRPLNPRGREAAPRMGRFLAGAGQVPELVLSSTAVRAAETVRRAAAAGEWGCPVEHRRELYGCTVAEALALLRALDDRLSSVLLAGHEPTWSQLAGALVGDARVRFPTAAIARIDSPVDRWSELSPGTCELRWLVTPKLLDG